jgi:hypothetical protein
VSNGRSIDGVGRLHYEDSLKLGPNVSIRNLQSGHHRK